MRSQSNIQLSHFHIIVDDENSIIFLDKQIGVVYHLIKPDYLYIVSFVAAGKIELNFDNPPSELIFADILKALKKQEILNTNNPPGAVLTEQMTELLTSQFEKKNSVKNFRTGLVVSVPPGFKIPTIPGHVGVWIASEGVHYVRKDDIEDSPELNQLLLPGSAIKFTRLLGHDEYQHLFWILEYITPAQ